MTSVAVKTCDMIAALAITFLNSENTQMQATKGILADLSLLLTSWMKDPFGGF